MKTNRDNLCSVWFCFRFHICEKNMEAGPEVVWFFFCGIMFLGRNRLVFIQRLNPRSLSQILDYPRCVDASNLCFRLRLDAHTLQDGIEAYRGKVHSSMPVLGEKNVDPLVDDLRRWGRCNTPGPAHGTRHRRAQAHFIEGWVPPT